MGFWFFSTFHCWLQVGASSIIGKLTWGKLIVQDDRGAEDQMKIMSAKLEFFCREFLMVHETRDDFEILSEDLSFKIVLNGILKEPYLKWSFL